MENIQEDLLRLSLCRNKSRRKEDDEHRVIISRIIPCASDVAIRSTVWALFKFTIGEGTFTSDEENARVGCVPPFLFRADRVDPDDARTVVLVVGHFYLRLAEKRTELATQFYRFVVEEVKNGFMAAWTDAIQSPDAVDRGTYDLSPLKYFSAIFADLFAVHLPPPDDFPTALNSLLALASGPVLTKLLLYDVMSRATTGPARRRLPLSQWKLLLMKWAVSAKEDPRRVGRTRADIEMFVDDAGKERQGWCAVPFIVGASEDLEDLCAKIAEEARKAGWVRALEK
ncbi:hypothetical protein FA13DRAFT_1843437 [Coprinellus micaceus]|uniref:Uncharacterized protein n=1 Tax=Coprinellus micaceus TaxID=71717 RepID=A0A4Y7SDU8_COPMI|nr:hypothetical protein FA13DRAFT_1843437 [Coprinellus micaceus]